MITATKTLNITHVKMSIVALLLYVFSATTSFAALRTELENTLHANRAYHPCATLLISANKVREGVNSRALSIPGYDPYNFNDMNHIAVRVLIPDFIKVFVIKLVYDLKPEATTQERTLLNEKAIKVLRAATATRWMRNKERQLRDLGTIMSTLDDVADLETFFSLEGSVKTALFAVFARAHNRVTTPTEQALFRNVFSRLMTEFDQALLAVPSLDAQQDILAFKTLPYVDQQFVLMYLKNYYYLGEFYKYTPDMKADRITIQRIAYGVLLRNVVQIWLISITGSKRAAQEHMVAWRDELPRIKSRIAIKTRLNSWLESFKTSQPTAHNPQ